MNASDLFPPSEYLKSEDVDEVGGEMTLTITSVSRKEYVDEENGGKKEVKGQLTFSETEKKLALNVTNTNTMIGMYGGENIDTVWVGKVITVWVDHNVQYGKKIVSGLRIRPEAPKISRADLLKRYNKLFDEASALEVDSLETFVLKPDATDATIIELGKTLRDKVASAKAF